MKMDIVPKNSGPRGIHHERAIRLNATIKQSMEMDIVPNKHNTSKKEVQSPFISARHNLLDLQHRQMQ